MNIERMQQEQAEYEVLELLVEQDHLSGSALGIAKQVLAGARPLSDSQQYIFDKKIKPYFHMVCANDEMPMETFEVVEALRNFDSLCERCRYGLEKANEPD